MLSHTACIHYTESTLLICWAFDSVSTLIHAQLIRKYVSRTVNVILTMATLWCLFDLLFFIFHWNLPSLDVCCVLPENMSIDVILWDTLHTYLVFDWLLWSQCINSCLINAQALPAQRPAADDNSLIGCTRPQPDRWLIAAQCPFRWQLLISISVLVWVRSFIEPDVLKTMCRSTIPLRFILSICSGN